MKKQTISEEFKRMRVLAGLITESQLNELSPELLQRAADKAKEQGRTLKANKFSQAANAIKYKAAQIAKDAKLEPVKPFIGKKFNLYYDVKTDKGIIPAIGILFNIDIIQEDTSGVLIIALSTDTKYDIYKYPHFYFLPNEDHFTLSSNTSGNTYVIRGMDKAGANMMWKLAKAFKPDTKITPNTLIQGIPTPLAGDSFTPYKQPQAESLNIESIVNEALAKFRKK